MIEVEGISTSNIIVVQFLALESNLLLIDVRQWQVHCEGERAFEQLVENLRVVDLELTNFDFYIAHILQVKVFLLLELVAEGLLDLVKFAFSLFGRRLFIVLRANLKVVELILQVLLGLLLGGLTSQKRRHVLLWRLLGAMQTFPSPSRVLLLESGPHHSLEVLCSL